MTKKQLLALTILLFFAGTIFAQDDFTLVKEGEKAPDFTFQTLDGQTKKLSDLKGKVVLIDFWASWCKPCRKENPNIVKVYQEYKDESFKNGETFTVLSVSLDFKKPAWQKAIKDDQLEWPYHVSDLKGWRNEAAQLYNVKSIPQSYLVDGDGVIVAINLRGSELESKLRKLRKKGLFFSLRN